MMRTVRPSRRKADNPDGSKKPCYAIGSPCANLIMARRRHAAPRTGRRYDCCRDLSSLVAIKAQSAGATSQGDRAPPRFRLTGGVQIRVRRRGIGFRGRTLRRSDTRASRTPPRSRRHTNEGAEGRDTRGWACRGGCGARTDAKWRARFRDRRSPCVGYSNRRCQPKR